LGGKGKEAKNETNDGRGKEKKRWLSRNGAKLGPQTAVVTT